MAREWQEPLALENIEARPLFHERIRFAACARDGKSRYIVLLRLGNIPMSFRVLRPAAQPWNILYRSLQAGDPAPRSRLLRHSKATAGATPSSRPL